MILRIIAAILLSVSAIMAPTRAGAVRPAKGDLAAMLNLSDDELLRRGNRYLTETNRPDSALICFSIIADRYSPGMPREHLLPCARALNNCGFIYYYFYYDFPEALNSLLLARDLCERLDDKALTANVYLNLGNCYTMCFELGLSAEISDSTLEYFARGYRNALEVRQWPILLNCFANLADAPLNGACPGFVSAIVKSFPDVGVPPEEPLYDYFIQLAKASSAAIDGDYAAALECLRAMLSIYDDLGPTLINQVEIKADILSSMAYCAQHAGQCAEAVDLSHQLIDFSRQIDRPYYEGLAYKRLQAWYASQGDKARARDARLHFLEIKDSLMARDNLMMVSNMELIAGIRRDNRDYLYKEQQYERRIMMLGDWLSSWP